MTGPLKWVLRVLGLAGLILFGGFFGATFVSADAVERVGQTFIKYQVEKEVREKYGRVADSTYGKALGRLKGKYESEAREIQAALNENLPAKIANVIAAMCRLDCKQRQSIKESIEAGYKTRLAATGGAIDTLTELIRGKYLEIVEKLTRDVRIFTGSNALLFLLVAALAFLKPRAAVQLYLPAIVLVIATVISSGLYLFGQNWFLTILYNNYVGFGYVAYVGVLFGFLCDIAFNKARVTTEIVNAILQAVGSALQAVPC
jgi:hypothetical protein